MGSVMAGGGPGSERGAGDSGVPGEEGKHIWRTLGHWRRCWRSEWGRDGRMGGGGRGGVEWWQKQAVALLGEKELWMPYNQQKCHDETENLSQE